MYIHCSKNNYFLPKYLGFKHKFVKQSAVRPFAKIHFPYGSVIMFLRAIMSYNAVYEHTEKFLKYDI